MARHGDGTFTGCGWLNGERLTGGCLGSQGLVRRECIDAVGLFDTTVVQYAEDTEFYLRIVQRYPVAFVNRPLVRYRVRSDGISATVSARTKVKRSVHYQTMVERHLAQHPVDLCSGARRSLAGYFWRVGRVKFSVNELAAAQRLLARCLRYDPFRWRAVPYLLAACLPSAQLHCLRRVRQIVRGARP